MIDLVDCLNNMVNEQNIAPTKPNLSERLTELLNKYTLADIIYCLATRCEEQANYNLRVLNKQAAADDWIDDARMLYRLKLNN